MEERDLRSERIEAEALRSLHAHCPEPTREQLGLSLLQVGEAWVAVAERDPSILLNRALGLGCLQPVGRSELEAVLEPYAGRGVQKFFVHVYPDSLSEDAEALRAQLGLRRARGWRKFHRERAPAPSAETDLRVERVDASGAAHFGRIVCTAFGMSDAAVPLMSGLVHDPRWHLFVSYDGDRPAGAGALMIDQGVGWLEWGATDPAFRRRGSQGAIMSARIQTALDAGCSHLFTETGEAVEGDPQHSYRNIQRYGFVEGLLRDNWTPG